MRLWLEIELGAKPTSGGGELGQPRKGDSKRAEGMIDTEKLKAAGQSYLDWADRIEERVNKGLSFFASFDRFALQTTSARAGKDRCAQHERF